MADFFAGRRRIDAKPFSLVHHSFFLFFFYHLYFDINTSTSPSTSAAWFGSASCHLHLIREITSVKLASIPFRFKGSSGANNMATQTMHHHRSTTKTTNKPFKSKHASKGTLKDQEKGAQQHKSQYSAKSILTTVQAKSSGALARPLTSN